jgi:hypothetical protein
MRSLRSRAPLVLARARVRRRERRCAPRARSGRRRRSPSRPRPCSRSSKKPRRARRADQQGHGHREQGSRARDQEAARRQSDRSQGSAPRDELHREVSEAPFGAFESSLPEGNTRRSFCLESPSREGRSLKIYLFRGCSGLVSAVGRALRRSGGADAIVAMAVAARPRIEGKIRVMTSGNEQGSPMSRSSWQRSATASTCAGGMESGRATPGTRPLPRTAAEPHRAKGRSARPEPCPRAPRSGVTPPRASRTTSAPSSDRAPTSVGEAAGGAARRSARLRQVPFFL